MKVQSKGMATPPAAEAPAVNMKEIKNIVFACDAGMVPAPWAPPFCRSV